VAYSNVTTSFISKNGINYNLQYEPSSGKVQIIQQNAATGTVPIYQDGNWNVSATQIGLTAADRQSFHNSVQESIRNAHTKAGGNSKGAVLPPFAQLQNQGKPPGQTSTTPANGTAITNNGSGGGLGNVLNAVINPAEAFKNFSVNGDKFGVVNEKDLFNGKKVSLMYPNDMRRETQDNFVISQYRYKPSKADAIFGGTDVAKQILGGGLQTSSNYSLEQLVGTVYLPMPNSVGDSNNVDWGGDAMNNLAAAAAANTTGNMVASGATAALGSLTGVGADRALAVKNLIKLIANGAVSEELSLMTGAGASSKLLKMGGFGVETESLLARGAGIVPNSNLELLFNSPVLRQFTFTYKMTARSEKEAQTIRRIIRFFKQGMSAKKVSGKAGQASFFLGTPNVFRLEYRTGRNSPIDGVNKFKTCALTGFDCDYAPDGVGWAAYDKGQPLSTKMTMRFYELEPIYDTDYQENNIFDGRVDLFSVSNDSVGY
jgi:hypothetical protein